VKHVDTFLNDLEEFRTPREMEAYFKSKKDIINKDSEYKELARLKKGLFKKFLEEFYPLYCFSQSKYCENDTQMKIVLGNQGYDAIIRYSDGKESKFEFTCYHDGKWEYEDAIRLNSQGYGDIRFVDQMDLNSRSLDYLDKILRNIGKKSEKDYTGVNIIIVVKTFDYFEVYDNDSQEFVDLLISEVARISMKADKIYLMVLNSDISYIDDHIHQIL
jgi:hypothetical protein